ncbi:arsenate-mycothiol transferase ArsC [Curvivirga aplysinae]|uniref:arsenate-mycothiol transferase ArsC n=1 Tax=Curvivirga aplysinae TaxID=2529852 RepID=UPI001C3F9E20|nr:arsenate reductase ArsC [Curvivirga aplysinae]
MTNILFVCTGNSCRSILAEAIFNHYGHGLITAYSAGTHPVGDVNMGAEACLYRHGISSEGLFSKSWEDDCFPTFDAVVTVCDHATLLEPPVWQGNPVSSHWGLTDPASYVCDAREMTRVFEDVFLKLEHSAKSLMVELDNNPADVDLAKILSRLSLNYTAEFRMSA